HHRNGRVVAGAMPFGPDPESSQCRARFGTNDNEVRRIALTRVISLIKKMPGCRDILKQHGIMARRGKVFEADLGLEFSRPVTLKGSIGWIEPEVLFDGRTIAVAAKIKCQDRYAFFLELSGQGIPSFHLTVLTDRVKEDGGRSPFAFVAGIIGAL